ncbi:MULTISPECIES: acyl-CoA dehydrogenase family protein [Cupriavidus]|uniref:Acyl-CoA dehydrogenase, C-terminal:Acyl-CoA dehydrogenase, central region n=1 Tax=Cupriavidus pinatubonensis (strain JMP 134 / LMG 1197) TaxID=264198 RepID=Q46V73_CUPPJ|nr:MULTISPECIES: acyl-CoA dehydrogenase family protein [Cupriavidus]QYY29265.1 acyl-CoA dehydrogenase family protein [Cupriavidus pinatubonensis]
MHLEFSEQDLQFRDEVRAWIDEAYDAELRAMMAQSKNGYLDKAGQVRWQKALYARGWAAPNWPEAYGGPGWSPTQRHIFQSELAAAGCPPVSPMGLKMVAPVIMKYGTDAQKARFLPPILKSDVWWCQGYSEPNSGSDLASLQLRADLATDGDGAHYLLNGSKIWTTHAQWADWMFCLVRTSRDARRQEGISFVLVDMRTPGITVAPLPTLDGPVPGQQEVNQVFFDNVRVPVENRIGEEGMGWTYAKYLLEFERGGTYGPTLRKQLAKVAAIAADQPGDDGKTLLEDAGFRRKLAQLHLRAAGLQAVELKLFSGVESGKSIGAASSMLKLLGTEAMQAISELAVEAAGPAALPFVQDTWAEVQGREAPPRVGPDYAAVLAPRYFNYRKASIYGGSNEIQRNIIAKLMLGL